MGNIVFNNLNTFRDIFFGLSCTGYFRSDTLKLCAVNKPICTALRKRCFDLVHFLQDDLRNGKESLINGYELLQNGDLAQTGLAGELGRIGFIRHLHSDLFNRYLDMLYLPREAVFVLTNRNTDIREFCSQREKYIRNLTFSINEMVEAYIFLYQIFEEPPQFMSREHQYYFDRCLFYKHYVAAQKLSDIIGLHFSRTIVDKDGNPVDIRDFMRLVAKSIIMR